MSSPTTLLVSQHILPLSPASLSYYWKLKSVKPFSSTSRGRWSPYTMTWSSTEAFGLRNRDGDAVFGQEAHTSASRAGFMAEGLQATLNELSRWIIAAVFGAVMVCRHDIVAVWFAGGAVLNNLLSLLLKRILNQQRPHSHAHLRSDPGMPSSHAQNIFYISTFALISIFELLGTNDYTILTGLVTLPLATYFTWLRVSQKLHTVSQVSVGAVLGMIIAISWYWSWDAIAKQAFESMLLVRVLVILGAVAACLNFIAQVFLHWFRNES